MDQSIYHGSISKDTCEQLLCKKGKDGAFLIRDSETIQGALCLCVYKQNVVYTYRILQSHTGYFTLQTTAGMKEKFFKTLVELVHNYREKDQGLATPLRHPVRRSKVPDQYVPDDTSEYENVATVSKPRSVLPP